MGDIYNLLNQFADDTEMCLEYRQEVIQETVNTFQRLYLHTGLSVNYDKTSLYRIGSLKKSKAELYTQPAIKWTSEPINVLGIMITQNNDEEELNYHTTVDKMRDTFNVWKRRSLSLIGKVLIINVLIASMFVYKMLVLPDISRNLMKKTEQQFRDFLWSGKKSKIALKTLQAPKSQGGLQLIDLKIKEAALKISWIQILRDDQETAEIAYASMGKIVYSLKENIWRCNMHVQDLKYLGNNNKFWNDVLKHWARLNYDSTTCARQVIWMNSYIRIQNKPVAWTACIRRGLIWIHQLFQDGELIKEDEAKCRYGLNFMQLDALQNAIPTQWKRLLMQGKDGGYCRDDDVQLI